MEGVCAGDGGGIASMALGQVCCTLESRAWSCRMYCGSVLILPMAGFPRSFYSDPWLERDLVENLMMARVNE